MMYPYKYLSSLPKALLDELVQGNVVPFVGAGFSKNADIPDGLTVPDWPELGQAVADEMSIPCANLSSLKILSIYEGENTRRSLIDLLYRLLNVEHVRAGATHKAFCEVFRGTVCTTNFDFLLEQGYRGINANVTTIVTEDRLSMTDHNDARVIKIHGDFNHPNRMTVTEGDYTLWARNSPIMTTYLANLFITKTILLIGYSLDDFDLQTLWDVTNSNVGRMARKAYCISVGSSESKSALYKLRNVIPITLPGDPKDYKTILRDLFVEMNHYINKKKNKTSSMSIKPLGSIINMNDVEGFCIGDTRHRGCMIKEDLSSAKKTVVTIDFSLTKVDLCSVVYYIKDSRDWRSFLTDNRHICFEICTTSETPVKAEVEAHLLGRNIRIPIDITNTVQPVQIPLSRFTKTAAAWSETKEICFLFHKENINSQTDIEIIDLHIE